MSTDAPQDKPTVTEPSKEVKNEVTAEGLRIETNWEEVVTSFDEMNLKDELLRGIYAYGFEKPSAIQQRGIMPVLAGHDSICQAQSGTGFDHFNAFYSIYLFISSISCVIDLHLSIFSVA